MSTLPTAAAPRAAAEAAAKWRTHAAVKKDVATVMGSAGVVTSPSLPVKRKQKHPQPVEPSNCQDGAEVERIGAIPQFDGLGLGVAAVYAAAHNTATTQRSSHH
jgi:hypothetical protein